MRLLVTGPAQTGGSATTPAPQARERDLPARTYSAHGLTVQSCVPHVGRAVAHASPDVEVRFGIVPRALPVARTRGARFEATEDEFILHVDGIARYFVRGGREIVIEPDPAASDHDVRIFLHGSAWTALLQQRGVLALHAAAIDTPRGAILLAGPSGAGKSTVLAALLSRGLGMLADDLVGVSLDDTQSPVVYQGFPGVKLWADAAEQVGCDTTGLSRVRPLLNKFIVPTMPVGTGSRPVTSVYLLSTHNGLELEFEALGEAAGFDAVHSQMRIARAVRGLATQVPLFEIAAALANRARIVQIRRPRDRFVLDQLAERILQDLN